MSLRLALPAIESDAAQLFRDYKLDKIADMPPTPVSYYNNLDQSSIVIVAEKLGNIVGFATIIPIDGQAYLKEVSVHRSVSRKGIGQKLISTALKLAKEAGYQFMTLTTFLDVPFNAPSYAKSGFTTFSPDSNWPELIAIREEERRNGIEAMSRIAMIKTL